MTTTMTISSARDYNEDPYFIDSSHVAMVGRMLDSLLSYLDQKTGKEIKSTGSLGILRVFCSVISYIQSSFDARSPNVDDFLGDDDAEEEPAWLVRLDMEMKLDSSGKFDDLEGGEDGIFGEESTAHRSGGDALEFEDKKESTYSDNENENDGNSQAGDASSFDLEVRTVNSILSRCSYLLCNSNLKDQIVCCDAVTSGFRFLGTVGALRKSLSSCGEGANNPLLPAIAEFWPSILARLRSTCLSLLSSRQLSTSDLSIRQLMAKDCEQHPSRTGLEALLSKLLEIIAEMCTFSDGFFVDRFISDVYPILVRLLGNLVLEILPETTSSSGNRLEAQRKFEASPVSEKRIVILARVLKCLECVYTSSCKIGLEPLISPLGTTILPLLSIPGQIGDGAIAVLKAMLRVNCDALWRGLWKLSGKPLPARPMGEVSAAEALSVGTVVTVARPRGSADVILLERVGKLLVFVDELEEQEI